MRPELEFKQDLSTSLGFPELSADRPGPVIQHDLFRHATHSLIWKLWLFLRFCKYFCWITLVLASAPMTALGRQLVDRHTSAPDRRCRVRKQTGRARPVRDCSCFFKGAYHSSRIRLTIQD